MSSAGEAAHGAVLVEICGSVGRVTINRPEARNALSPSVVTGLDAAIDASLDARCSVVVVRGVDGTLSAGADLKHLLGVVDEPDALRHYITSIGATLDRLEAAPFVSVCVVDGYALAGGCEILLACDLAVVSETSAIGDRHLEYGLVPGAGGSVRLTRALPPMLARRLLYTGELIDGRTAAQLGLVSHVVPAADLDAAVDALVARLDRHDPGALALMKRLHANARTTEAPRAIAEERDALLEHLSSATAREGLSAFAEGRRPDFRRTAPASVVP